MNNFCALAIKSYSEIESDSYCWSEFYNGCLWVLTAAIFLRFDFKVPPPADRDFRW